MKSNPLVLFALGTNAEQFEEGPWSKVAHLLQTVRPNLRRGLLATQQEVTAKKFPSLAFEFVDHLKHDSLATGKSYESIEQYSRLSESSEFQQFRFIALKLLNRIDLTGTFRFLEREVYLQSSILQALGILLRRKPDLVIFDVTPHEFHPFVLRFVSEWLGIKVLFFQPCSMAPAMIARNTMRGVVAPAQAVVASSPLAHEILSFIPRHLRGLMDGIDPIYIERQRGRDRTVSSPGHLLKALPATIKWLWKDRFPRSKDFTGHLHGDGVLVRLGKIIFSRSLQQNLRKSANLVGLGREIQGKYCVLALHYEPERTSLPDGLPIDFQGDAVARTRALLPRDTKLVVKEHYSQQSAALRGFAGRSPDFYGFVESFPNTQFAPTESRLSELVGGAACVFTLTGTVAIESVLRGTPVGFFGSPWWEGLPGTIRLTKNVTHSQITSLNPPEVEDVSDFLERLCAGSMIPGLAGESVETMKYRLGPLPVGFFDSVARSVSICVLDELDRN